MDGEAATRADIGSTSILFHPDYYRRLRPLTESADPAVAGARGLKQRRVANRLYRRWGITPRPENNVAWKATALLSRWKRYDATIG